MDNLVYLNMLSKVKNMISDSSSTFVETLGLYIDEDGDLCQVDEEKNG